MEMTFNEQLVHQMYIAYYQRPADPEGLKYWVGQIEEHGSWEAVSAAFGAPENPEYQALYGDKTRAELVAAIYQAAFNRPAVQEEIDFWVNGEHTDLNLAFAIINGAQNDDKATVNKKVAFSDELASQLGSNAAYKTLDDASDVKALLGAVDKDTGVDSSYVTDILGDAGLTPAPVDPSEPGVTHELTNGTDILEGNVFNAGMVFTPNGGDRILSLQDEDVLTGTAGRDDNTLNATMGNRNADEGTTATTTPYLYNIQNVNVDWTGNTTTLDLRNADATSKINIKRVTGDATNVTVDNIGTPAADLRVASTASDDVAVTFSYKQGVLTGNETLKLELNEVLAQSVTQDARGVGASIEGFETVNLHAVNGVDLSTLSINEMEKLVITGSGELKIATLTPTTGPTAVEYLALGAPGIANPAAVGLLDLDASAFTGNLTLDITNSLGVFADPRDSGKTVHGKVTGGTGNDTFWTSAGIAATSATNRVQIDGGEGNNKIVMVGGNVAGNAAISNIQALELRTQAGNQTVDFDAFDDQLTSVLLRDEKVGGATTFTLNDLGATLAESGNIVLRHGATGHGLQTVVANLKADTANDTVVVTVENDRNTGTTFDYTIDADITGSTTAAQGVENVTVHDNDTESNILTLTKATEHKGTITLTGGVAGQSYTVDSTLIAKTVDASAQKSNLVLTVGQEDQTIKLGSGDDLLTFDGLDTFNGLDNITDAGGTDTVRAAFSKDVAGVPGLAGIENLHIVATENATLDLAKATDLTQLVLMSDYAVDQPNEVFSTGIAIGQVAINDVITLKNTKLSEVNFWGDEDATVAGATVQVVQTFNGLTLENNNGDSVRVNIAAPLQNLTNLAGDGITTYNLGQLTTHGVKDLSIEVANEVAGGATTNINNIWDRDLVNLSIKAVGNVNVGTVTGNTVNSNIKTFDASAVGGDVTAVVKALGDNAKVTLADGDNNFDALGSAGNNVTIQAGNGDNQIRGTAQSDYIYTGSGNDVIHADRGNNTVKSGAGDDIVTALNGSNTVDLGSGKADNVTFSYDTPAQMNLATNVVAGSGTNAFIYFDSDNDGVFTTATDAVYGFAVGDGAELSIKFTGTTFDPVASTLNGRSAIHADGVVVGSVLPTAAGVTGSPIYDANQSNLVVFTVNPVLNESFAGGSAADVFLDLSTGAGNAYNVSAGAGNDAIIISQESTAAHIITGGTGADRIVLSALAAKTGDTIVIAEGDSTLAGWDVITNFVSGTDTLNLATIQTGAAANVTGFAAAFDFDGDGNVDTFAVAATGEITITDGNVARGENYFGGVFSAEALLQYLAANSTVVNDTFWFNYDSNGDGAIGAGDNAFVFQNLGTDLVVELVGTAAAAATFDTTSDIS